MKCNEKLRPDYFSVNVSILAVARGRQNPFFKICQQNTVASTEWYGCFFQKRPAPQCR